MRPRSRLVLVAAGLAAGVAALGACGGDDDGGSGGGTVTATDGMVTLEARDVEFDVDTIESAAGPLDVTLLQKGSVDHTFLVEDADGEKINGTLAVSTSEKQASGTYELEPGEYEFYCDIAGHRGQGMEGTLIVE